VVEVGPDELEVLALKSTAMTFSLESLFCLQVSITLW